MAYHKDLINKIVGGRDKNKFYFLVVNTLVNLLFLVRSYILMQILDYKQLGQVALFQTVVLIISTMHFGILNGGYRLYCTENRDEKENINNLFYTFSLAIMLFSIIPIYLIEQFKGYKELAYFSMITGMFTMVKFWVNNQLIAIEKLKLLSNINLLTILLSFLLLAFYRINPLLFSLLSIFSQTLSFVVIIFFYVNEFRPTKIDFNFRVFKKIMKSGFLVFITGLLLLINAQIERFSIVNFIGVEGLGHYYLAIMFVTLFAIIPSSLDSIYLPQVLKMYKEKSYSLIRASLISQLKILIGYSILSSIVLFLLAKPVILYFLPKYQNDLIYVYLIFPGLVVYTLSNSYALIFNILNKFKYYLFAYLGGSLIIFMGTIFWYKNYGSLSLEVISIIKSISFSFIGGCLLFGYFILTANEKELRFRLNFNNK